MHLPGYAATALVRGGPGTNLAPVKRDLISGTVRRSYGRSPIVSAAAHPAPIVKTFSSLGQGSVAARSCQFRTSLRGTAIRSSKSTSQTCDSRSSPSTHAVALPMDPARSAPIAPPAAPPRPIRPAPHTPASETASSSEPEAIPGDHMENARAGLPDGVSSMIVDNFTLECGIEMRNVVVAYSTYGSLNATGDNGVIVGHSLTSNSNVHEWWPQMLGANDRSDDEKDLGFCLDTASDFVVCVNYCGSPYGSASPLTPNPHRADGGSYGADFPLFTIRDHVRLQKEVLDRLGVKKLRLAIGGSMGGMIALEWGATFPNYVDQMVLIASCGRHTDWAIGIGQVQRAAIMSDEAFQGGKYLESTAKPEQGLANARMMAMLTYRAPGSIDEKFGRSFTENEGMSTWAVESYLQYQGEKFIGRFDANCYLRLTASLDTHNVAAGRGQYGEVLQSLAQKTLVVGIDSDMLYPLQLQQELAQYLPNSYMHTIKSPHGHDSFLIEIDALNETISRFRHGLNPSSSAAAAEDLAASCDSPEETSEVLIEALGEAMQTAEQSEKEIVRLNLKLQALEAKLRDSDVPNDEIRDLCTPSVADLRDMDHRVVERLRKSKTPWGSARAPKLNPSETMDIPVRTPPVVLPVVYGDLAEGEGNKPGWA